MPHQNIEMKYVNTKGEYCKKDDENVAFQINPSDGESQNLVKALKDREAGNKTESRPVSAGDAAPRK